MGWAQCKHKGSYEKKEGMSESEMFEDATQLNLKLKQVKECRWLLESGKGKKLILPQGLQKGCSLENTLNFSQMWANTASNVAGEET